MINLNDNRYQFLRFEVVRTGKWVVPKESKPDLGSFPAFQLLRSTPYEETKEVAVVFDKQTGKVKQMDIEKLKFK